MRKRLVCLMLTFLLLTSNIISPVSATSTSVSSSVAGEQSESGKEQGNKIVGEEEGAGDSQGENQALCVESNEDNSTNENQKVTTETQDNTSEDENGLSNDEDKIIDDSKQEESSEDSSKMNVISESEEENLDESSSNMDISDDLGNQQGQNDANSLQTDVIATTGEENSNDGVQDDGSLETVVNAGQVDVSISAALALERAVDFTIELSGPTKVSNQTISLDKEGSQTSKVSFVQLSAGQYILKVTAPGFADYSQKIDVNQNGYSVKLMTGFVEGYSYEEGSLHPGVLLIGDVDGNGSIDDTDKDLLVDAIDNGAEVSGNVSDLNGDGLVDLVDLQYFVKGYKATGNLEASLEYFVPASVVQSTVSDETIVADGNLEELLVGTSSVTLKPQNDDIISSENPVSLAFDFANVSGENGDEILTTDAIVIGTGNETTGNHVTNAQIEVTYIDENGEEQTIIADVIEEESGLFRAARSNVTATISADGTIQVNLGSQVAVKKVTLTIFGTKNNTNLAEISSVEFVNGMEERIPEVDMSIPENLKAVAGDKVITLSWDACTNITGYEVQISTGGKTETIQVAGNALTITSFAGDELKNLTTYTMKVQSINGTWKSGYCDAVEATPQPTKRPDKPDNVTAAGKYRSIIVSWKNMSDTESYNVYYKERDGEGDYTKVEGIKTNTYTITGLTDLIEYEIYVTGVNGFGESAASLHCLATTTDLNLAVVPKYGLINRSERPGEVSEHITNVTGAGIMKDSPLDTASGTAWGTVDDDEASYYYRDGWDDGGYNALGNKGITYTFDKAYKLDTIRLRQHSGATISFAKVRWWDESGKDQGEIGASVSTKRDSEGRAYVEIILAQPINASKIQIGFAIYPQQGSTITIADIYFYYYDTLEEEIMTSLYEDDLHTVLKDTTTQEVIDDLRSRVNTVDEISGEYNPKKESLLKELDLAEQILNDGALKDAKTVPIRTEINAPDVNLKRGFRGLNALQPLGVTAAAGEQVTIYVGSSTQSTGAKTNIRLYCTQYHAESNSMTLGYFSSLKVGANTFTVPASSLAQQEGGGALYVDYQGATTNTRYAVRVSGGVQVPLLDLYKVTDKQERLEKTKAYVEELETYVPKMEALHEEVHKGSSNKSVQLDYDEQNCILGASDIMLDTMLLSLPAQQILSGAGDGSVEEKAQKIVDSMDAIEEMMNLFYQHKGLSKDANDAVDKIPTTHLNIRYQRMFSGAFMYAAGDHIGIEYPQAKIMVGGKPIVSEDGKYVSGNYFGWGIAHEIGHCINQTAYEVAEVTNNYFAQLAQAKDTNEGMRFDYRDIYDKVTSGAKGSSSNGATQLGLYWQLHLAYDKEYNYKTYDNYDEQLANLFYARMDTYARTPAKAPKPGDIALTLESGNSDQNLMRLACAAAQKDILEFFERWGKVPNETTKAYAAQFEKETRAIYYVSDDSRVYSMNGQSSLSSDGTTEAIGDVAYKVNPNVANQVDFTFSSQNISEDDILGYEITRCMISGGKVEKQVVGFTTNNTFSDTITSVNNRTVYYEISLIDKYLNRSATKTLGQLKIEHDGSLDKTNWTISVDGLTAKENIIEPDDNSISCEQTKENAALSAIDHDIATEYIATVDKDNAQILMEFNKTQVITGFKYTAGSNGAALGDYEIQVKSDGSWVTAAEGSFDEDAVNTVYFANADNKYISTYEADAVKLIVKGKTGIEVAIAELDVLGVTGDNVDFRRADDSDNTTVIGTLKSDYKYGQEEDDVIPANSIVFMGSYKGNPAYNVVILFDQDGNIVGGVDEEGALKAQQIILADVPDGGNITDTSDGTWIYWIEPGQDVDLSSITSVRTELYRVNNALTNEGQRLVSDSLFETMPEELKQIEISSDKTVSQVEEN